MIHNGQTVVRMEIVPVLPVASGKTDVRRVCVIMKEMTRGVMEQEMNIMTSTLTNMMRTPTVSRERRTGKEKCDD